jgi:hypothetical protein
MPAAPQGCGQRQHLCCGCTNAPDALQLSSKGLGSSQLLPCLLLLLLSSSRLLPLLLLQTGLPLVALLLPQVLMARAGSCCGAITAPAGITAATVGLNPCDRIALRGLLLWLWLRPWGGQ